MRTTGTVKWFEETKRFGFIAREDGEEDVFLHHSVVQANGLATLAVGDRVEFDLVRGRRGPAAENLVKL